MIIDHANGKQAFSPAIDIPVDYVTPSVLHIFLGVVADFFRKIESLGKKIDPSKILLDDIERVLCSHGIERKSWHMVFNGIAFEVI